MTRLATAAALCALSLSLTACGEDSDDNPGSEAAAAAPLLVAAPEPVEAATVAAPPRVEAAVAAPSQA